MRRLLMLLIIGLMLTSSVSAYGGVGGGILVPIKEKQHNQIFRHEFGNVSGYTFTCSNYDQAILLNNHMFVNKICPDNYPIKQMSANITTAGYGAVEVYVFKPVKKMKIKRAEVQLSLMVRTKPVQEGDFKIQVELPKQGRFAAYTGKNLNKWTSTDLNLISQGRDTNLYELAFDEETKYISITKR